MNILFATTEAATKAAESTKSNELTFFDVIVVIFFLGIVCSGSLVKNLIKSITGKRR